MAIPQLASGLLEATPVNDDCPYRVAAANGGCGFWNDRVPCPGAGAVADPSINEGLCIPVPGRARLSCERKAVHPDPLRRYDELFEFVHDLRHPNGELLDSNPSPLLERNPLLFWKGLSLALAALLLLMLAFQYGRFR